MNNIANLLIIGSQKAGTTSLYHLLNSHGEIFMSPTKEINFFINPKLYNQGLNYYSRYFQDSENFKWRGEASPGYICYPNTANKIIAANPNMKLILIIRNPIDRALSQYWDNRRQLGENQSFSSAIKKYLHDDFDPKSKGYFSRGNYVKYINEYLNYFDKDNILILIFEKMVKSDMYSIDLISKFLNIDSSGFKDKLKTHNSSKIYSNKIYNTLLNNPGISRLFPMKAKRLVKYGEMTDFNYPEPKKDDIEKLILFYKSKNEELASLLNLDLSIWNEGQNFQSI